ncbi:MAG: antitoxin [Thermoleophilia bacterium]|nr:antitoxin [Thermoleophilia bacterium]
MLTHRLQVLIDPEQYERLQREAETRRTTIAVVVRDAIDRAVPVTATLRREAADFLLGLDPIPLPDDPDELEAELDAMFDEAG